MRQSREAMAESRRRILDHAARLFRERGLAGVSVVDVMSAAGMTHGGFYKHFASKDELAAEALKNAFASIARAFDDDMQAAGPSAAARSYIERYLQPGHVERPGQGCPVAALGGEIARAGGPVRAAYDQGVTKLARRLAQGAFGQSVDAGERALALLATLAGTVMTARAAQGGDLRLAILAAGGAAARKHLEAE
jgi:TetR/AcrR family transcriptional repressor of nem operon